MEQNFRKMEAVAQFLNLTKPSHGTRSTKTKCPWVALIEKLETPKQEGVSDHHQHRPAWSQHLHQRKWQTGASIRWTWRQESFKMPAGIHWKALWANLRTAADWERFYQTLMWVRTRGPEESERLEQSSPSTSSNWAARAPFQDVTHAEEKLLGGKTGTKGNVLIKVRDGSRARKPPKVSHYVFEYYTKKRQTEILWS